MCKVKMIAATRPESFYFGTSMAKAMKPFVSGKEV